MRERSGARNRAIKTHFFEDQFHNSDSHPRATKLYGGLAGRAEFPQKQRNRNFNKSFLCTHLKNDETAGDCEGDEPRGSCGWTKAERDSMECRNLKQSIENIAVN